MSYCLLAVTKFFYQVFYRQLFYFILPRWLSTFVTVYTTITVITVTAVTAVTTAVIIFGLLLF